MTHQPENNNGVSNSQLSIALQELPALMQTVTRAWATPDGGEQPTIIRRMLAGLPVIILLDPHHAEWVLRARANHFPKGTSPTANHQMVQRLRQMRPHLHRSKLMQLHRAMVTLIDRQLTHDQAGWANTNAPNLQHDLQQLAQELMIKSLFGFHLKANECDQIANACRTLAQPTLLNLPLASLSPAEQMRHAEAIAAMQAIASQTLRHNLQVAAAGGEAENLFSWLATAESEAEIAPTLAALPLQLSEFSLLVDAASNIATTLCAALDLLLRHPEALTRLQAEIGEQLGEESPTVEQLTQLHYTQQVVRETLRLRPPVSWLLRIAADEERIEQETIPAGALIILPIAHYQRNPVFWPNPDHFLPERFAEKPEHPLAWLAFGAGQRLCLGKDFSLITCQLILAMLIQRLEFVG